MESTETTQMTIGALAKAAEVGVETVRFYQRKGILETPEAVSGYRTYSSSHVRIIKFAKKVQQLGFTLSDAQDFLGLTGCSPETQPLLAEICDRKIREIEKKKADLNRMLEMLQQFHRTCGNEAMNDSHCSLLDCFENNWDCCENSEKGESNE